MEASPSYYKTVAMACGAVVAAYTAYSMATKKKQSEGTYQLMDGNAVKKAVTKGKATKAVAKTAVPKFRKAIGKSGAKK